MILMVRDCKGEYRFGCSYGNRIGGRFYSDLNTDAFHGFCSRNSKKCSCFGWRPFPISWEEGGNRETVFLSGGTFIFLNEESLVENSTGNF